MNNLYLVVSEQLYYQDSSYHDPPEVYCICALVVAKSASQAKYLAYVREDGMPSDIRDIPKFYTELKLKNVPFDPQVLSNNPADDLGLDDSINAWLWVWKDQFLRFEYQQALKEANEEMNEMMQEFS